MKYKRKHSYDVTSTVHQLLVKRTYFSTDSKFLNVSVTNEVQTEASNLINFLQINIAHVFYAWLE